ncbi:MAG: SpoIIE family protein phosphatase [Inquilinus sp.]|nr:SpoIIE family protein phosphatase [Inquilinus sp.]
MASPVGKTARAPARGRPTDQYGQLAQSFARIAAAVEGGGPLATALEPLCALLGARAAALLTLEGDTLVCVASHGLGDGKVEPEIADQPLAGEPLDEWLTNSVDSWFAERGIKTIRVVAAPLVGAGRPVGAVVVAGGPRRVVFTADDRRFLEIASSLLSLGVANARLVDAAADQAANQDRHNRDLALAAEIQRSLLPAPEASGTAVIGLNRPARTVSGDFFDYFMLADGRVRFALGDVSGKGMNAALLMAKTASLFRCIGKVVEDPARLLGLINRELVETASRGMFVTMVAGVYSPDTGEVRFANAGHLPPLLRGIDRSYREFPADAPPLGLVDDLGCGTESITLDGGEFFVFSDGLTEFQHGASDVLGVDGLIQLLEAMNELPMEERLNALLAELDGDGWQARDDLTVLAIDDSRANRAVKCRPAEEDIPLTAIQPTAETGFECLAYLRLPAEVDRMRLVRGAVAGAAGVCGFDDETTADIVLAVAEAGQNVILHAYRGRPGEVMELEILRRRDALVIRLRDFAAPADPTKVEPRDLDDLVPGGLGTHFIREIMDSVEFLPPPDGLGNLLQLTKRIE